MKQSRGAQVEVRLPRCLGIFAPIRLDRHEGVGYNASFYSKLHINRDTSGTFSKYVVEINRIWIVPLMKRGTSMGETTPIPRIS